MSSQIQKNNTLRVAIVHDWLTGMRGGEKVLEVMCKLFPDATLVTLLHNKGAMSPIIEQMKIKTSFIQCLPFKSNQYRHYLLLMPLAIELLDFSKYDIIISTSHAVAKCAKPHKDALHICYCHTPMRYIWDQYQDYFGKGRANIVTRIAMSIVAPFLRWWDVCTSKRVHYFIANSYNVAERIQRIYKRKADVIHPPVDTSKFSVSNKDSGYYLIVSALVPYKRVDLAIEAFNRNNEKLLVVGTGPEEKRLKQNSKKNIEFLGWQSTENLAQLYAGCRALIFPGIEDFGIVPLEAMASGKPVIAFAKGGALETVVADGDSPTGVFFYEQNADSLIQAIEKSTSIKFDPFTIRKQAEKFDQTVFEQKIVNYINKIIGDKEDLKNKIQRSEK